MSHVKHLYFETIFKPCNFQNLATFANSKYTLTKILKILLHILVIRELNCVEPHNEPCGTFRILGVLILISK